MEYIKKSFALLLTLVMVFSIIPMASVESKAIDTSEIKSKLDTFIKSYPSGSRWTSSFDGGSQCYGFAKLVVYNIFGKNSSGGYRSWTYAGVSTSGMNVIGSVTSFSADNVKSLLSKAQVGDVLQFDSTKQHSMIVYSVESDGVYIYDCNWDNNCGVSLRKCSFGVWSGRSSNKLTLLRSDNATHTHSYTTYVYYEAAHPHYGCYKCSCGAVARKLSETHLVTSCSDCSDIATYTFTASPSSLTMRVGETKSITFTESSSGFTVYMNGKYSSSYLSIEEFGGWVDGCKRTITIKALKEGNTSIIMDLYSSLTDKVMKTVTVPITILPDTFSVAYDANGGTGAPAAQTKYYNQSLTLSTTKPTRTGYDFAGWDNQYPATRAYYSPGSSYTENAAVTLYAYWKPIEYVVQYISNGGSGNMSVQTHIYDEAKNLLSNNYTKTGYTFSGWSTSSTATTATYTNCQSVKNLASTKCVLNLYAIWQPNNYKINYNANGGIGTMTASSHTYDTAKALSANTFTRTGYTFLGWSLSSSASLPTYTDKQSVKNLTDVNGDTVTLYAVWQKNAATLSSVSVQTLPKITSYNVGDSFTSSGLELKATYSDGSVKIITSGFTVSSPDMSTAGTKTVTVSYEGKITSFNITVKAVSVNGAALRLGDVTAMCGQKITIPVTIEKTALSVFTINISYDSSKLEFVSVDDIPFDMSEVNTSTPGKIRITCIDSSAVPEGTVANISFNVTANSACTTTVTADIEEAFDSDDNAVAVEVVNSTVKISNTLPGDVNGDGKVSAIDARLVLQATAGIKVLTQTQKAAADVNGDGKVSAIDARKILKIVAGLA